MSMKEKVRVHLKGLKDESTFTIKGLGKVLLVNDNAISNEICGMVPFGALTKRTMMPVGAHRMVNKYTVNQKVMVAFYLKFPNGCHDAKEVLKSNLPKVATTSASSPRPNQSITRRTAWQVKVDVMIVKVEKQLEALRITRDISL